MKKYFSGTLRLIRFTLRRERINIIIWLAVLTALTTVVAGVFSGLFSSPEELASMGSMLNMPSTIAMLGPLYGADNLTVGGLFSSSMLLYSAIAVAIMNIFFVVRNTRGDEERGRIEVIRSLPTGRLSNLSATLITALGINILLALLIGFSLALVGVETINLSGSILYGFALGGVGMFFAGYSAFISQTTSNSKGVMSNCIGSLLINYMVRAVGDVKSEILSMLSPFGIVLRIQGFVKNIWWPVAILFLSAAGLAAMAFFLNLLRDLDQGFLPQRKGKKEASAFLKKHEGLIFRFVRNTAIAWIVGIAAVAVAYGSLMGQMEELITGSEFFKNAIVAPPGHTQTEVFMSLIVAIIAIASAIPVIGTVLKLCSEELLHRYESIVSKKLSRQRILTGYLVTGFIISFLTLFAAMLGLWIASNAVLDEKLTFGAVFSMVMVYLPAIWICLGIAVLLFGVIPEKASAAAYGYLGFSFLVIYLGSLMNFPDWINYLTPFGYIPNLPIDSVNFLTLILLTIVSAALIVAGYIFYRRRDLRG